MRPLFSVGEEVILQSVDLPHLNGEYIVEKILHGGEETVCHITKFIYIKSFNGMGYSYILGGLSDKNTLMSDGVTRELERSWYESALRKKHKPSGDSFENMIDKIKSLHNDSEKTS